MTTKIIILLMGIFINIEAFGQETDPRKLYQLGSQKMIENDLYNSIDYFLLALKINPNYLDAIVGLAKSYFYLKEYKEAYSYILLAEKNSQNDFEVLNWKGRILLVLNRQEEAKKVFDSILTQDPYNIDAIIGKSQFFLINGDINSALISYLGNNTSIGAYAIDPKNKVVLTSLALFYEYQGDLDKALFYTKDALRYFSYDPQIQILAANLYYKKKQYDVAKEFARNAISFSKNLKEGYLILTQILISEEKYEEALDYIKTIIERKPSIVQYYYVYAYILSKLSKHEEAIKVLKKALALDYDNAFIRSFMDSEINILYPDLDNKNRKGYSDYYYNVGKNYMQGNSYNKTKAIFKEALNIYPKNTKIRKSLAKIELLQKLDGIYLEQVKIILNNETDKNEKQKYEEIKENFENVLLNNVSNKWDINQFEVSKDKFKFRIFYKQEDQNLEYFKSEEFLVQKLQKALSNYQKITFRKLDKYNIADFKPVEVKNSSQAFRIARESKIDYYIMVSFKNHEDYIQENIKLYVSTLGKVIYDNNFYSGGKYNVLNSYYKIGESLSSVLPVRGSILKLNGNNGIINLGKLDNIKEGDILYGIKSSDLELNNSSLGYSYDTKNFTGKIQIIKTDDNISEFKILDISVTNKLSESDAIISINKENDVSTRSINNFQMLYNEIKDIR